MSLSLWAAGAAVTTYNLNSLKAPSTSKKGRTPVKDEPIEMEQWSKDLTDMKQRGRITLRANASLLLETPVQAGNAHAFLNSIDTKTELALENAMLFMARSLFDAMAWKNSMGIGNFSSDAKFAEAVFWSLLASRRRLPSCVRSPYRPYLRTAPQFTDVSVATFNVLCAPELSDHLSSLKATVRSEVLQHMIRARYGQFTKTTFEAVPYLGQSFAQQLPDSTYLRGIIVRGVNLPLVTRNTVLSVTSGFPFTADNVAEFDPMVGLKTVPSYNPNFTRAHQGTPFLPQYYVSPVLDTIILFTGVSECASNSHTDLKMAFQDYFTAPGMGMKAINSYASMLTSIGHDSSTVEVFSRGSIQTTKGRATLRYQRPVVVTHPHYPALTLQHRVLVGGLSRSVLTVAAKWQPNSLKLLSKPETNRKTRSRRVEEESIDEARAKYHESLGHMYRVMLGGLTTADVDTVVQALGLGLKFKLSEKQAEVVTNPGNMVVIGRSGSGKSLSLLLRVAVQYYKLLDLNDESLLNAFTVVVCTRSHNLLRDLIERWNTLTDAIGGPLARMKTPLYDEASEGFIESEESILEILMQTDNSLMPGASLNHHDSGPVFCTTRKLISLIDETLDNPYFDHTDTKKVGNSWGLSAHGTASLRRQKIEMMDVNPELALDEDIIEAFVTGDADQADSYVGMEVSFELFASVVYPLCVFHYRCQHEVKPSKVPNREQCKNFAGVNVSQVYKELMSTVFGSVTALRVGIPAASYIYDHRTTNITQRDAAYIRAIAFSYSALKIVMQLYDINDVITYIYRQIISHGYHGTPVHSFVVDEAQDSPITLVQLLTQVCGSNMASIVVAGDTAQAIADGIEFRFKDVHEAASRVAVDGKPVTMVDLDVNYRSTSKVCELGNHLINLMKIYPKSIDMAEELSFKRSGSGAAVFFEHASHADLDDLLSRSKRELADAKGSIFGAKQAVIVRSYADVPPELERSLVLTVEDAKGLEFDDILLYNFFTNSPIEAEWHYFTLLFADNGAYTEGFLDRVVSYGKDDLLATQDHTRFRLAEAFKRVEFNANLGKARHITQMKENAVEHIRDMPVIAHELKSLYVAVTRARSRVFFFDSDEVRRTPVMAEWARLGLVQRIDMDEAKADGLAINDEETSAAEWELDAQKYMASLSFSAAMQCYRRVPGMERMVLVCKAISLARSAIERNGGALVTDKSSVVYHKLSDFLFRIMNPTLGPRDTRSHALEADSLESIVDGKNRDVGPLLTEAGQIFMQLGYSRLAARCLAASHDYKGAAQAYIDMGKPEEAAECLMRGNMREDAIELLLMNGLTDEVCRYVYNWFIAPPASRYMAKQAHLPNYPKIAQLLEPFVPALEMFAASSIPVMAQTLCFAIAHTAHDLVPFFNALVDSPKVAEHPAFVDIIRLGISLITGSKPHALTDVSSSTRILLAAVQGVPRHVALPCITSLCGALADFPLYGMLFQSIMDNDPWAIFESIIDSPPARVLEKGRADPNLLIRLATVCDDVRKCKNVSTDDRLLLAQALVECKCHLGLIFAVDDDITAWIERSIQVTFGGNLKPNVQAPRITPHDCVLAVQVYCAFLALPHLRREDSTVTPAMAVEACVRIILNDQLVQIMTAQNLGMSQSMQMYALGMILEHREHPAVQGLGKKLGLMFANALRSSLAPLFEELRKPDSLSAVSILPIAKAMSNMIVFTGRDSLLELGGTVMQFAAKTLAVHSLEELGNIAYDLDDEVAEISDELAAVAEEDFGDTAPTALYEKKDRLEARVSNLFALEDIWRWTRVVVNEPDWETFEDLMPFFQQFINEPTALGQLVRALCPDFEPDVDVDYLDSEENEAIASHVATIHPLPGVKAAAVPEPIAEADCEFDSVQFKVTREEMKREISAMVLAGCTDQGYFEYIESVLDGKLEALIEATQTEWAESVKECGLPDDVNYRTLFRLYERL
ncbi:ATP-dependent DNA helicase PcrA [Carpediemonas membranifera]|uniref:ATP-dependent DNA helicase PcrA n=1 Tax=Carpediemonas membranifera TaxID=201153 RepID=A0A8J6ASC2_9EUKA|nr:ATP-dependent DNA helicase PcrA [Carpediemonas membranifera]|eukprot:KAG9393211.1 ATP-dependent DNA helicase PcrA [Carpediemonas membranifera]